MRGCNGLGFRILRLGPSKDEYGLAVWHVFCFGVSKMRGHPPFLGPANEENNVWASNSPRHPASGRSDPFKDPLYPATAWNRVETPHMHG